jgi:lipooligosaccharide transport system permease protein
VLEHLYARTPAKFRSAVVAGLVSPAFFLALLGVGLGSLVDERQAAGAGTALGTDSYLEFIGPGLLAVSAIMWSFGQSLWPTAATVSWDKTYVLTAATPVSKAEIAVAHVGWIVLRFMVAATLFTAVLAVAGAVSSWWALLAPVAAGATVAALSSVVCAFTIRQDDEKLFPVILRVGAIPMFLFSGAFFPLTEVPAVVAWLVRLLPGWHGVELCRALARGTLDSNAVTIHVVYLIAVTALGMIAVITGFEKRLDDA